MPWITPKTNWIAADGVANTDLNRIEGNTVELDTRVKTWENFKTSGGTINGPINTPKATIKDIVMDRDGIANIYTGVDSHGDKTKAYSISFKGLTGVFSGVQWSDDWGWHPMSHLQRPLGSEYQGWKEIYAGSFSKKTTGYSYQVNGTLTQWGSSGFQSGNTQIKLIFPIAFPKECVCVMLMMTGSSSQNPTDCICSLISKSATECTFIYNKPRDEFQGFDYLAIGF